MRRMLLVAGLAVAAPRVHAGPPPDEIYAQALTAYDAGDHAGALATFRRLLGHLGPGHGLYPGTLFGLGQAARALVERDPAHPAACDGAGWFDAWLADPGAADRGAIARATEGRDLLRAACAAQAPPPEAPPPIVVETPAPVEGPGYALAWALTGGAAVALAGGAVLYALALGEADDYHAGNGVRPAAESRAIRDDVRNYEISGYALLGLGAALGGLAAWRWLAAEPGDGGVALRLSATAIGVGGTW